MSQTTTEKKKTKNQLTFNFSFARSPEYIKPENKEEKGKVHYLVPKDKLTDKKVPTGTYFRKQTFFNVDFRYRHNGINEVARQAGVNLKDLEPGNVVVFFNTSKTQFLMAFSNQTILHHNNGNTKIEVRAIDDVIRHVMRTGKMSYDDGLADFLRKRGHGATEETVRKNPKLN